MVRGLGRCYDHPLPTTVTERIKSLLLSKSAYEIFKTGNSYREECEILSVNVLNQLDCHQVTNDITDPNESNMTIADEAEGEQFHVVVDSLNQQKSGTDCPGNEDEDLLKMLAGYIAYRLQKNTSLPALTMEKTQESVVLRTLTGSRLFREEVCSMA